MIIVALADHKHNFKIASLEVILITAQHTCDTSNIMNISNDQVTAWVKKYVHAWETGKKEDIQVLFAKDAEYREWPYETQLVGRDAIVKGWQARQQWQDGGWSFDWSILDIKKDTAVIEGTGTYKELGTFGNFWLVTLNDEGKCTMFRMWNGELQ